MSISAFFLMAPTAAANGEPVNQTPMIIGMVVLMIVMYFIMFRQPRKRQKEEQEMRANIEIGDEIITIGGIVGRVVTVREEDIIIETGADRTKLRILRGAISSNKTKTEQHQKEIDAAKAAAKEKKNKKSKDSDATNE